ncbi:hypothetical protein [Mucilaginibacter sp.]
MKKRLLFALLFISSLGVAIAAVADLTGKWTGSVSAPDGGNYGLTYNLKAEGAKLTGTVETPVGTAPITDGKISGNDFSFNVSLNGTDVPNKGKYYTDSIGVDIDYSGTIMHAKMLRAAK